MSDLTFLKRTTLDELAAEQYDASRLGIRLEVIVTRLHLRLRCDCGEVHPDSGNWSCYRGVVRELAARAKHDGWVFLKDAPRCPECYRRLILDVVLGVEQDLVESNRLHEGEAP